MLSETTPASPTTEKPPASPKAARVKAYSPQQLIKKKRVLYPFEGRFLESFGTPERHAKWFIIGRSYSGKSSFVFILCQYLSQFGSIDYNSHEEGDSQTVVEKLQRHGLAATSNFKLLDKVPTPEWLQRLQKRKSASFGILDSLQHGGMNQSSYRSFVSKLCNPRRGKSLIFISHKSSNDFTLFVRHDCDIKIEVIGFIAYVQSRYGGNKPFVIWEEGAKKHWGKKYKQVISGDYWPGIKK